MNILNKKRLSLLITAIVLCSVTYSQTDFKREMSIGASAGATLSKVSMRPKSSPKVNEFYQPGITAGIAFRYITEPVFGFQAELNFAQHGWKEDFKGEPYSFSRTLNYIELPFMTHIFFGNKTVRGFVNLGPRVGLYLGDSYTSNFDISNLPAFTNIRHTEHFILPVHYKLDYGICGGAGFELMIGKHSFNLEGRYYFGLADIFGNRVRDYFSSSNNQSISVAITYLFAL